MTRDSSETNQTPEPTAEQVVAYLRAHPDFLSRHPQAIDLLQLPSRDMGEGVVDFQSAMIQRLRLDVDGHSSRHRELLDTSRANLSIQTRIHECVLAELDARSFEQLIQIISTDFAVLLDLDIVTLCIEAEAGNIEAEYTQGLWVLAPGSVDAVLGADEFMILRADIEGDEAIFGGGASLVRSEALVRLEISTATPPALLAFGSRDADKFHPNQSTELLGFLAAATESVIRGWLTLPA